MKFKTQLSPVLHRLGTNLTEGKKLLQSQIAKSLLLLLLGLSQLVSGAPCLAQISATPPVVSPNPAVRTTLAVFNDQPLRTT
jgi:hypothetical protein